MLIKLDHLPLRSNPRIGPDAGHGPDQAQLDAAHPVQLRGEEEQRCCALLQQSCAESDSQVRRYSEGGLEEPAVVSFAALSISHGPRS